MGKKGRRKTLSPKGLKVGLTGSLASGKSTVLSIFKKAGWKTLSADQIVADVYRRFKIEKPKALPTKAGIRKLEEWLHPIFKREMLRFLKKQAKKKVLVEVPLLFEAGFQKYFDLNMMVFAPRALRKKRAIKRGMPEKLFELLESLQWAPSRKARLADFVLINKQKRRLFERASAFARTFLEKNL